MYQKYYVQLLSRAHRVIFWSKNTLTEYVYIYFIYAQWKRMKFFDYFLHLLKTSYLQLRDKMPTLYRTKFFTVIYENYLFLYEEIPGTSDQRTVIHSFSVTRREKVVCREKLRNPTKVHVSGAYWKICYRGDHMRRTFVCFFHVYT